MCLDREGRRERRKAGAMEARNLFIYESHVSSAAVLKVKGLSKGEGFGQVVLSDKKPDAID
jgi:hypothetical protein